VGLEFVGVVAFVAAAAFVAAFGFDTFLQDLASVVGAFVVVAFVEASVGAFDVYQF
jgi:hypothetical protein